MAGHLSLQGNAQGELSPLEIGLHALDSVTLGNRWSENGGLKAYADAVSKSSAYITQVRKAADVFQFIKLSQLNLMDGIKLSNLMDKTQHLNEIHKSPQPLWPILVQAMLAKGWSVKDTKAHVDSAELIWRLAKDGKTQDATGKILGWSLSKVKQYSALNGISWPLAKINPFMLAGIDPLVAQRMTGWEKGETGCPSQLGLSWLGREW